MLVGRLDLQKKVNGFLLYYVLKQLMVRTQKRLEVGHFSITLHHFTLIRDWILNLLLVSCTT